MTQPMQKPFSSTAKPFAWSFSALDAYELCPKKYAAEKVYRSVKDKKNEAANYGDEVHKRFEQRLLRGTSLPLDLVHHEARLSYLDGLPGQPMPEQRLALTRELKPTGFFDSDVWVRGIVDYAKHNGNLLVIVDHKTGRVKEGFDQIELMAAMMSCYLPEVEGFALMYHWTKEKRFTRKKMHKVEIPAIWNKFLPRVSRMEEALKTETFPARKNFLCKRYCQVTSCPHHGG